LNVLNGAKRLNGLTCLNSYPTGAIVATVRHLRSSLITADEVIQDGDLVEYLGAPFRRSTGTCRRRRAGTGRAGLLPSAARE
jgi:hypothetical protein